MERDEVSVAVGVGFSTLATAEAIARIVRLALERAGKTTDALHTSARKRDSAPLKQAADSLRLKLVFHEEADLQKRDAQVVSRSSLVMTLTGVGSLDEAAALAGAGENARLIVEKFSLNGVSCAVAIASEFS
jgi:cobalt-precorrin 5A hydrolase